jgi:hypothetical protein
MVVVGVAGWLFSPVSPEPVNAFMGRRGVLLMFIECTCPDPNCARVQRVLVPPYALDAHP